MRSNPPPGCKVTLADENDMTTWEAMMDGPSDSPYAGGHFKLVITLPSEYPFKPPKVAFKTKIYHPNVMNDDSGSMCLGMLRADEWKPPNKIADVLRLVRTVLSAPQPDDAVEQKIAKEFKDERKLFDKNAKDWVSRYAK